jgi:hypothetical protein
VIFACWGGCATNRVEEPALVSFRLNPAAEEFAVLDLPLRPAYSGLWNAKETRIPNSLVNASADCHPMVLF